MFEDENEVLAALSGARIVKAFFHDQYNGTLQIDLEGLDSVFIQGCDNGSMSIESRTPLEIALDRQRELESEIAMLKFQRKNLDAKIEEKDNLTKATWTKMQATIDRLSAELERIKHGKDSPISTSS